MAFGTHSISSFRYNRNMQNDYKFRSSHKKSALRSYFSKARHSGAIIRDHLSSIERAKVREKVKSARNRRTAGNIVVFILVIVLLYSMVSYIS